MYTHEVSIYLPSEEGWFLFFEKKTMTQKNILWLPKVCLQIENQVLFLFFHLK